MLAGCSLCGCVCMHVQMIVHRIGPGMVQQIQRPCSFCRGEGDMIDGKRVVVGLGVCVWGGGGGGVLLCM